MEGSAVFRLVGLRVLMGRSTDRRGADDPPCERTYRTAMRPLRGSSETSPGSGEESSGRGLERFEPESLVEVFGQASSDWCWTANLRSAWLPRSSSLRAMLLRWCSTVRTPM